MTNQTIIENLTLLPPPPWWQNPWVWLVVILLVICLTLLWRARHRFLPKKLEPRVIPGPPPENEALRLLAELKTNHAKMSAYEISIDCSEILRRYIEAKFVLPIRYQTTREFLEAAHASLKGEQRAELGSFLQFFDGVKFARDSAAPEKTLIAINDAEKFVRRCASGGVQAT